MAKTALIYGFIAVIIITALMMISMALIGLDEDSYDMGEIIGYSGMFIATGITVYLGVKSTRDKKNNGTLTLKKGAFTGISIVATTYIIYTLVSYFGFYYNNTEFADSYYNAKVEEVKLDATLSEEKKQSTLDYYASVREMPPILLAASEGVYMLIFGIVYSVIIAFSLKTAVNGPKGQPT